MLIVIRFRLIVVVVLKRLVRILGLTLVVMRFVLQDVLLIYLGSVIEQDLYGFLNVPLCPQECGHISPLVRESHQAQLLNVLAHLRLLLCLLVHFRVILHLHLIPFNYLISVPRLRFHFDVFCFYHN